MLSAGGEQSQYQARPSRLEVPLAVVAVHVEVFAVVVRLVVQNDVGRRHSTDKSLRKGLLAARSCCNNTSACIYYTALAEIIHFSFTFLH